LDLDDIAVELAKILTAFCVSVSEWDSRNGSRDSVARREIIGKREDDRAVLCRDLFSF